MTLNRTNNDPKIEFRENTDCYAKVIDKNQGL